MNNQILLLSVVLLSVSVAFLFYQNVKLSKKLDQQYKLVHGHINDLSQTIALNNNIKLQGGGGNNQVMTPVNNNNSVEELNMELPENSFSPEVTPEFQQEINQLKSDYNDYELSSELKNEIDNLRLEEGEGEEKVDTNLDEYNELNDINLERELVVENLDLEESTDNITEINCETDLNKEIIDWNNDIEDIEDTEDIENVDDVGELDEVQEISLEPTLSHDVDEIRAEVVEGVNNLVGNIIASASDVENIKDENTQITLENIDDQVSVNLNNESRSLEDLNGNELKEVCKHFNLKAKGKKIELIERIKDYQLNLKNSKNFFVYTNN